MEHFSYLFKPQTAMNDGHLTEKTITNCEDNGKDCNLLLRYMMRGFLRENSPSSPNSRNQNFNKSNNKNEFYPFLHAPISL